MSLAHLHAPRVSVREQADIIVARLRSHPVLTFRALTGGDAPDQLTVVCRFLALLELFRQRAVSFEQAAPLGELTIRWTGRAETELARSTNSTRRCPAPMTMSARMTTTTTRRPGERAMAEVPADRWPAALEALLLMADEPMRTATMAEALGIPEPAVTPILTELAAEYTRTGRGFELRRAGGGWRYYTRPEFADVLAEWVVSGRHARLSQAALETLAVVAYLQPVSRARVAAIRGGVSVDGVMRTLVARGLITEAGADERTGGATQFVTTDHFLTRLGLNSLTELPPLAPHLPDTADLADELGRLAESGPTEPDPHPDQPPARPRPRGSPMSETPPRPTKASACRRSCRRPASPPDGRPSR